MATDYLSLFAAQHNFSKYKNKIYGIYNGYNVCIEMRASTIAAYFSTQVLDQKAFNNCLQIQAKQRGIVDYQILPPFVVVIAQNVAIVTLLDFVTQLLALCKSSTDALCPLCQLRVLEENKTYFTMNEVVSVAHTRCVDTLIDKMNLKLTALSGQKPWYKSLLNVALSTVILTLIVTIVTMLSSQSFVSLYMMGSLVIGYLLLTFYQLSKAKICIAMYIVCAVAGLISVFAIQTLATGYLVLSGTTLTFSRALLIVFNYWTDKETFSTMFLELFLAYCAFACGVAAKGLQRRNMLNRTIIKIKKI